VGIGNYYQQCDNGVRRVLYLIADTITGTVVKDNPPSVPGGYPDRQFSGFETETWNVYEYGVNPRLPGTTAVDKLVITSTVQMAFAPIGSWPYPQ
jgi:hypothetical protein